MDFFGRFKIVGYIRKNLSSRISKPIVIILDLLRMLTFFAR